MAVPSERPPTQVALGAAIRALRDERGVSQEALALNIGVHRTYVGSVERGERNIGLLNVMAIAHGLGIQGSELLARAGL